MQYFTYLELLTPHEQHENLIFFRIGTSTLHKLWTFYPNYTLQSMNIQFSFNRFLWHIYLIRRKETNKNEINLSNKNPAYIKGLVEDMFYLANKARKQLELAYRYVIYWCFPSDFALIMNIWVLWFIVGICICLFFSQINRF